MSELIYGYGTDKGIEKNINEDRLLVEKSNKNNGLFVIADGMGGHSCGEKASSMTVEELRKQYRIHGNSIELENQVIDINNAIYSEANNNGIIMGTTVSSLLICKNDFYICNVGDSRVYIIRDGIIKQITEDDSLVYQQYKAGVISKKKYLKSDKKNILIKSLGGESDILPSTYGGRVEANDIFVLACDGLYNVFTEEELGNIILSMLKARKNIEKIAIYMVEEAKRRRSTDNISIVIVWNMNNSKDIPKFSKIKYFFSKIKG